MHNTLRPQVYHTMQDTLAICALDADPSHKILEYLNLSHYKMLHGQFTEITKIGPCTHTDGRTHWVISFHAEPERR